MILKLTEEGYEDFLYARKLDVLWDTHSRGK